MAAGDARPIPRKNVAYRVTFPILDADGDLVTAAAALDSEVSVDGGTFADATSEATEIATSSGMYFLDLTAAEMNGDTVAVIVKTTTTGAKTTPLVLYPEEAGDVRVDVVQWLGTAAATPTVAGVPEVDITHFNGTAGTFAAGRPEVNTSHVAGTAQTAGDIMADTNDIQTRLPAALVGGRIDASVGAMAANVLTASAVADAAIDRAALAVDTGLQTVRSNTAQAGAAGNITLDASASAVDDFYNDHIIYLTGGTGVGQARLISDYVGATKVATTVPNWITNPDVTSTFAVLPTNRSDVGLWMGVAPSVLISGRVDANTQAMAVAVIASATFAANALDDAAAAVDLFDGAFSRASSNWEAAAGVKSLGAAVMKAVHRTRDNAGTLEIYRSNGTTIHASQTITTDAANNPIDELTGAI